MSTTTNPAAVDYSTIHADTRRERGAMADNIMKALALAGLLVIAVAAIWGALSLNHMATVSRCEALYPTGQGDTDIYAHRGDCIYPGATQED